MGIRPEPFNPPGGESGGIDPTPFRLLMVGPPDDSNPGFLGLLDFSNVTGFTGSLHLSGVQVLGLDASGNQTGEVFDVNPFVINSVPVPEPATFILFGFGLAGIVFIKSKKKRVT